MFYITRVYYNQVNLCSKWANGTVIFVCYKRLFVITEFVITSVFNNKSVYISNLESQLVGDLEYYTL